MAVAAARFRARLAGQARPFSAADLAAVLATCHHQRRRGRGVESDQVAAVRGESPMSTGRSAATRNVRAIPHAHPHGSEYREQQAEQQHPTERKRRHRRPPASPSLYKSISWSRPGQLPQPQECSRRLPALSRRSPHRGGTAAPFTVTVALGSLTLAVTATLVTLFAAGAV